MFKLGNIRKYFDFIKGDRALVLERREYTVMIVMILLFMLAHTLTHYYHHYVLMYLVQAVLLYLILLMILKNPRKSAIYTAVIAVILFVIHHQIYVSSGMIERFDSGEGAEKKAEKSEKDDKKDSEKKSESKEMDTDKIRAELEVLLKKLEEDHKSGKSKIDTSKLETFTERLTSGKIETKADDLKDNEPVGVDVNTLKSGPESPLTRAQKETYALIDTIGILKETVATLNPVLSEGRKVMDMFKGLQMDGAGGEGGAMDMAALSDMLKKTKE
jgi:Ca2+/Na+ antiporter